MWWKILLIVLIAFEMSILATVIGLRIIYRLVFHSPEKGQNNFYNIPKDEQFQAQKQKMTGLIDQLLAQPFKSVYIQSYDGLKLFGRYYHHADNAPLVIGFHGYRGTAIRDMVGLWKVCRLSKINLLIVDQRAHGKSEGNTISFGIRERYDCLAWTKYAAERFGENTPVFLCGVSMGAATVLMASDLDLPQNVCGILVDCPYASPEEIIKKVCRDRKLWDKVAYPLIWLSARIFGSFSLAETTAEEAVQKSKLPIVLMHGEDDRLIPCETSRRLAKLRPNIQLHTFEGAGHGLSGMLYSERYNKIALDFIEEQVNAFKNKTPNE